MAVNRRRFLQTLGAEGAVAAVPSFARGISVSPNALPISAAEAKLEPLEFVFFTDTHIEPELDAAHGCEMAFEKIAASKPEFAIMGGDHVFDALGVNQARANLVFDLYTSTAKSLGMPLYNTIGNHDAFGVLAGSGVAPTDPLYGKKMYEDRMGKTYYSFDRKGYHFVVLDSIQPMPDRLWEARVDDAQLDWLRSDLKALAPGTPVIGVVHCPIVTAFGTYAAMVAARAEIQHAHGGEFAGRAGSAGERARARGAAGAHTYQRARRVQRDSLHHQRRGVRKLVARRAHGHARRLQRDQRAGRRKSYAALRDLRFRFGGAGQGTSQPGTQQKSGASSTGSAAPAPAPPPK